MTTNRSKDKEIRKMQKYYRSVVTMTADRLGYNKDGLHSMFKVGFKKKTTSGIPYDSRYGFLENVLDFIAEVRGRRYDSDWRHHENISYYDLPYAMLDDWF